MDLQDQLNEDMKVAMKKGDKLRVETIRMVRAQMKYALIAKRETLEKPAGPGDLQGGDSRSRRLGPVGRYCRGRFDQTWNALYVSDLPHSLGGRALGRSGFRTSHKGSHRRSLGWFSV